MTSILHNTTEQSSVELTLEKESGRDVVSSFISPVDVAQNVRVILHDLLRTNQVPKAHLQLVRMSEESMYRLFADKGIIDRIQLQVEDIVNAWPIIIGGTPEAERSKMEQVYLLMRLALHKYVNVQSPHTHVSLHDSADESKDEMSDGGE